MVEAGVGDPIILKQVAASGPGFTVGIDEVLALKRAGASDDLIESLMSLAGVEPSEGDDRPAADLLPPALDGQEEESFRIFRERDEGGREVIHITNLDATGHRIGGPVAEELPAARNAYVSRDVEHSSGGSGGYSGEDDEGWRDGLSRSGEPAPPVIIQIFQPDAEQVAITRNDAGYGRAPYARGYLPGYPSSRCGSRCYQPFGVPSPPGSWSHYKRYHAGDSPGHEGLYNGGLGYRQAARFGYPYGARHGHPLTVPFNTAGAAQLNRMRANVRLGH